MCFVTQSYVHMGTHTVTGNHRFPDRMLKQDSLALTLRGILTTAPLPYHASPKIASWGEEGVGSPGQNTPLYQT